MAKNVFRLNYKRHAGQLELTKAVLDSNATIYTIVASRGFGKSLWATNDIVIPSLCGRPHSQVMWVAPWYKTCKAVVDDVWLGVDEKSGERFVSQFDNNSGFKFWDFRRGDMEIELYNRSRLFLRSSDNPDSIVAKGYNAIVIDEAPLVSKDVFMQHILPTARRAGCKIFLIGTPRGKNWFYEMYLAGQDLSKSEYFSIKLPWWKRPDFPEILKKLMNDMPQHLRQQEFEAEFISDGGGAFKNLGKVFVGDSIQFPSPDQEWSRPISAEEKASETFVLACDLAKSIDYTVMVVMAMNSKKVVHYSRFNKTDYRVVIEKLFRLADQYDADIIFDATGVGSGLSDFIQRRANVFPFKFTNESKNEIINRLIVACEYGEVELPNIHTMREEFELFTYHLTRTGALSYSAPDGKHDDTVIAVALANWYALENSGQTQVNDIEEWLSTIEAVSRPKSRYEQLLEEDD